MKKVLFLISLLIYTASIVAQPEKVALVIGNSNYLAGVPLPNPENDASDISRMLEAAGFQVMKYIDLKQAEMKIAIDEFGEVLNSSTIGLFYYAGHGIQAKGRNYLIPIDANLETENDVEYNCVDAGRVLAKMEDARNTTNIVILDACRNNPFERSWSRKSTGSGLAFVEAPSGSIIAYSTSPGKTASDGYDRNSPYTASLIQYLDMPNVKIEDFFKLVRSSVREKTGGVQTPWESTSLEGDFYFHFDPETANVPSGNLSDAELAEKPGNTVKEELSYEQQRELLAGKIKSLAILPFANYTGDETKEYLAFGMQDALINELGRLGQVRVISQTSTMKYINFENTIKEIASELKVDGVIETSLIGLGDNVRIQLKLYSVLPDEQQIWSQIYDEDLSDILNLYNEVIKNIADEIKLSLTAQKRQELNTSTKINPKAYEAYLKGKYYWGKLDLESMYKAIENFEQAIELEPEWADPYASLANAWNMFATYFRVKPRSEIDPITQKYLDRALELDPNSAQLHYVKALYAVWSEFNWSEGEKEFLKTLELNPNHALGRMYYAHLLTIFRKQDEAVVQANLGLQLDPFKPLVIWLHGMVMYSEGNNQEITIKDWEKALSIDPDFVSAAASLNDYYMKLAFESGDYRKWIDYWEQKVTSHGRWGEDNIAAVMKAFEKKGRIGAIKEMFKQNKKYGIKAYMSAGIKAERYLVLGEYDKAIDCLEDDFEKRDMSVAYILTDQKTYQKLKDYPRYINLLKKMQLYEYL